MADDISLKIKPDIDLSSLEQQGADIGRKLTSAINKNSEDAGKGYVAGINKAQKAFDRFQKAWTKLDQTTFKPRFDYSMFNTQLQQERDKLSQLTTQALDMQAARDKSIRWHKKRPYTVEDIATANQLADAQLRVVTAMEATEAKLKWYQKYDLSEQSDKNKTALLAMVGAVRDADNALKAAEQAEIDFANAQEEAAQAAQTKALQQQQAEYTKATVALQAYIDKARSGNATLQQITNGISQVINRMSEIESIPGPAPLPAEVQEEYSRLIVTLKDLQQRYMEVMRAKEASEQSQAQDQYTKATVALQKYIDKAREEKATLDNVTTAISHVVNRLAEIESIPGPALPADIINEYERLTNTLAELRSRWLEIKQAQEQAAQSAEYEQYAKATSALQRYIDKAREETATLDDVSTAISKIITRMAELETNSAYLTEAEINEYNRLKATLEELQGKYGELKRAGNTESMVKAIERVTASVSRLAKKLAQVSGHAIKSAFNSVRRSITGMGSDSNDTSKEIQSLIRNIVKYGFGVRSIYFLYRRLRTALVEALKDMAKFDTTGLGAAINQLSTSLQYLKSAWAAAFAPIVEYVTPVLVQLMDLLASVANAIAALFATLTGKGTVVKAVKQQKALAGALGGTGSAAADAAGKLAAFDELNIIGNDSGGGGGGGGGGAGDVPDGSFIVETIEGELADLINANKWFEIGQLFADKLNSLTEAADRWINDVFRPWGVKWATNLGNFMNGFIYHYNWELLGKTFADGINAIFDTANTWFTTVNWSWFGTRVADGLLSAIDTVDWTLIGKTLANKLNKTIDFLYGFVRRLFTNGGARKIGDAIAEGVNNFFTTIHWDNLGETLSNGFNGVFNVLNRFIRQYNWDEIGDMIANAFNTTIANLDVEKAGATLSTFVLKLFDQLDKIDLFAVGEKIGRFLTSIDWASIITKAIGNILELVSGIITGAFNGEYGAEIAMIIVTALGAQLALAFAKIKIAELIGGQFLAGVMKSAGASAGAAAGGEMASIASGLGGIAGSVAPILGVVAALGGVALMLKQSTDWLHEYNEEMHQLDSTVQEHIDSINLLKDQTEGYHEASKRQMTVYEVENQRVRDLADSYLNLFDENGKVKAGMEERAEYYYNQLADALGLEKDQLKTLVEKNGDLKTAIEEVITAKTQDRAISAYLDEYQHALDNTKIAQENVTNAEADHKKAVEDAETAQKNYQKALDDYIAIGAEAGDTTGEYKKRLDDAIKANSKAQYAVKATSQEVDAANDAMVKINATAKFYEGYMAAIATNDTTLITAALKRMEDGFITAEEGDKESLKRQVDNMEEYYQLLLEEMQKGNPNVTQEMLDDAKEWVNTADRELAKLEKAGSDGMEDLRKGMSSKKQALIAEAERTGQSLARAYKSSLEGVLNGVNMGTPTASLPTYSYQSTSGKITPKRAGYARLATGAVLPPNDPFLAVVGDQKHGTNIEAPLSTIEDAVRNVVGSDSNNSSEIVQLLQTLIDTVRDKNFSISKREVGDAAISEINTRTKRTGNSPILG